MDMNNMKVKAVSEKQADQCDKQPLSISSDMSPFDMVLEGWRQAEINMGEPLSRKEQAKLSVIILLSALAVEHERHPEHLDEIYKNFKKEFGISVEEKPKN